MKTIFKKIILSAAAISLLSVISFSQEKKETSILLSFFKKADNTKTAVVKVMAKNEEKKFVPAAEVSVNLYVKKEKEFVLLNKVVTDAEGNAVWTLSADLPLDAERYFTLTAKIENDNLYEDAEEEIHYKESRLSIKLHEEDSVRHITATVTETGADGNEIPVKEAEVTFFLKRLFGNMPLTEENAVSTDEKGEAQIVFPSGITGDSLGNITLIAALTDDETFGNVESNASEKWGIAVLPDKDPFPRALWAPRAPIQLILTLSILFGGVWLVYFFVFYQLNRIKKEK